MQKPLSRFALQRGDGVKSPFVVIFLAGENALANMVGRPSPLVFFFLTSADVFNFYRVACGMFAGYLCVCVCGVSVCVCVSLSVSVCVCVCVCV